MDDETRQRLGDIFRRHREEIIEDATDWVIEHAIDLGKNRPRDEVRKMSVATVEVYHSGLIDSDLEPAHRHIARAVSSRAAREYHVSTPLRGLASIRRALIHFVRTEITDERIVLDIFLAVDALYLDLSYLLADMFTVKLNETIQTRRLALEEELARVIEERTRELDAKVAIIEAQRKMLADLSSPVIRVWEGIVVVPIVGDMTAARGADLLEKALDSIARGGDDVLMLDITGATLVDVDVALRLKRLLDAAELLGAEGMLVGMSATMARAAIESGVDFGGVRSFATLKDGLRMALQAKRKRRAG